jgi:hypothetical protein
MTPWSEIMPDLWTQANITNGEEEEKKEGEGGGVEKVQNSCPKVINVVVKSHKTMQTTIDPPRFFCCNRSSASATSIEG